MENHLEQRKGFEDITQQAITRNLEQGWLIFANQKIFFMIHYILKIMVWNTKREFHAYKIRDPNITLDKIRKSFKDMQNCKKPGDDGIDVKDVKNGGLKLPQAIKLLFSAC